MSEFGEDFGFFDGPDGSAEEFNNRFAGLTFRGRPVTVKTETVDFGGDAGEIQQNRFFDPDGNELVMNEVTRNTAERFSFLNPKNIKKPAPKAAPKPAPKQKSKADIVKEEQAKVDEAKRQRQAIATRNEEREARAEARGDRQVTRSVRGGSSVSASSSSNRRGILAGALEDDGSGNQLTTRRSGRRSRLLGL